MEIRPDVIVPLGYGKFARSDTIIALEPIEENRGPGRRTFVYVEQLPNPMVASRTENSILTSMVEVRQEVAEAIAAFELLKDILDDLQQIGPMLRKSIKEEAKFNIDRTEKRIEEILKHEMENDVIQ